MTEKASRGVSSSHMFSIELVSRDCVKCLVMPTENGSKVLIEGYLGDLESLGVIEGVMLEINGSNGTMKMDLSVEEIAHLLTSKASQKSSAE